MNDVQTHRISETLISACYLYVYFMVTFGRSDALSRNNFHRCSEYEDKPLFLSLHTLGLIIDLLLDEPANEDFPSKNLFLNLERFLRVSY